MYFDQIVWLLFVPLLVYTSYRLILWFLKKLDKKIQ